MPPSTAPASPPAVAAPADTRLGGLVFAKLYPNPAEPFRGRFVADQVHATSSAIHWEVIAPVPLVPRWAAAAAGKPFAAGMRDDDGVWVHYTRYPVLPRRLLYATVPTAMVATSRSAFARAAGAVCARFVHAHELYPSGEAARRLAEKTGLPYVLTVHGSDLYLNLGNPRWKAGVLAAARDASALVCVGSRLAADCVELLGADPARILVVPNTYNVERFLLTEASSGCRNSNAENDGASGLAEPLRLLSVGRLSPEKGHEVLLQAFFKLRAQGMNATLTLVGDGSERIRLTELASSLGLGDRVRFTGVLLDDDLAEAMHAADIFVLPSHSEGFGVVLIEALATGLPVVATRSGGPEDIVDGENGVLVDVGDPSALAAGIADVAARLTDFDAATIAERTAQRYSPAAVGERLVALYREVVAGAPLTGTLASGDTGAVSLTVPAEGARGAEAR